MTHEMIAGYSQLRPCTALCLDTCRTPRNPASEPLTHPDSSLFQPRKRLTQTSTQHLISSPNTSNILVATK